MVLEIEGMQPMSCVLVSAATTSFFERRFSYDLFLRLLEDAPKDPLLGLLPNPSKEDEGLAFFLCLGGREDTGALVLGSVPFPVLLKPKPELTELSESDDVSLDEEAALLRFSLLALDCPPSLFSFAVDHAPKSPLFN